MVVIIFYCFVILPMQFSYRLRKLHGDFGQESLEFLLTLAIGKIHYIIIDSIDIIATFSN